MCVPLQYGAPLIDSLRSLRTQLIVLFVVRDALAVPTHQDDGISRHEGKWGLQLELILGEFDILAWYHYRTADDHSALLLRGLQLPISRRLI